MVRLDPGTLAIKLWVPNSLLFFVLFWFGFLLGIRRQLFANAASGNVYLVVAVTTNCMAAHGTGSLTLILQTGELPKKNNTRKWNGRAKKEDGCLQGSAVILPDL